MVLQHSITSIWNGISSNYKYVGYKNSTLKEAVTNITKRERYSNSLWCWEGFVVPCVWYLQTVNVDTSCSAAVGQTVIFPLSCSLEWLVLHATRRCYGYSDKHGERLLGAKQNKGLVASANAAILQEQHRHVILVIVDLYSIMLFCHCWCGNMACAWLWKGGWLLWYVNRNLWCFVYFKAELMVAK